MSTDEKRQEQISKYLDGMMTHEEAEAFEQQMAGDAELKQAVKDEALIVAAMQLAREQDLRAKLKQWRQKLPDPPPLPPTTPPPTTLPGKRKWWILVLVGGLLLLSLARWYFNSLSPNIVDNPALPTNTPPPVDSNQQRTTHDVAAPVDTPKTEVPAVKKRPKEFAMNRLDLASGPGGYRGFFSTNTRGNNPGETNPPDPETCATLALEKQDYKAALTCLEQANATDSKVRLLRAHALYGAKRFDEAAAAFQSVATSRQYGQDARWNVVMCYFVQYPKHEAEYRKALDDMLREEGTGLYKKAKEWEQLVAKSLPPQ